MANLAVISMNAGYMTPKVDTRSDVDKYSSGCRILDNMLPLIYGPVERRPGLEYIATAKNSPDTVRLIPFIYSSTISYPMEFGALYIRFYYDGARVLTAADDIVESVTPYGLADLPQIQYKQSADVMWLVHTSYPPYKLSRTTASAFSMAKIVFENGPFLERNDIAVKDDVTMTSSVTAADSAGTLTASAATFESGHVGALWKLTHKREDTVAKGSRTTVGVIDAAIDVKGSWTFSTHGNWGMTVEIQRNEDGTNWETFRTYTSVLTGGQGSRNVQKTDIEEVDGVQYRMYVSAVDTPAGTIQADLTVNDPTLDGIVRIDSITSTIVAVITVLSKVASTDATTRWAEGAWSGVRGYPTSFTFFEERAVYAGSTNNARRVWFSKTGEFENFETGVKDADAFELDLPTANTIRWVASLDALIIGTSGDEWRIRSTSIDAALTPTNFDIREQTARGCRNIQALEVNEAVLFVDFVGRKIRELTYSDERQKFMSPDLTSLAEDITVGGITALAHQRNPDSIVWCTVDGNLRSMTYEREQNVVAWAKHITSPGSVAYSEAPTADALDLAHNIPISNLTELQAMEDDLAASYYLTQDIDASGSTDLDGGSGFDPIGDATTKFTGTFDGCGYKITELYIDRTNYVGLFGYTNGATIYNLEIEDAEIHGESFIGALVGFAAATTGQDITITDTELGGGSQMGGLVGAGAGSTFTVCTTTGMTIGHDTGESYSWLGLFSGTCNGTFTDCFANGTILQTETAGGTATTLGGFIGSVTNTDVFVRCEVTGTMPLNSTSLNKTLFNTTTYGGFGGTYTAGAITTDCKYQNTLNHKAFIGTDEKQALGFINPDPTGGTYRLGFDGTWTGQIDHNATQAVIQAAIDAAFGADVIDIEYTPISFMFVYYRGQYYTRTDLAFMEIDMSNLIGGSGTYTAIESTKGAYAEPNIAPVATAIGDMGFDTGTTTTGVVETVAVIPGTDEDEVWIAVLREVNGGTARYIERMKPRSWGDDQEDCFFVDSGLSYDGEATDTFTGLDHLEGETVAILGDGAVYANETVASGSITINNEVEKAHVGLPYTYKVKPMRLDVTAQTGATHGSIKKISELVVSFLDTLNAQYGDGTDTYDIDWRKTEVYDSPPELFTGDKTVVFDGGFDVDDPILISGSDPTPCTVRAIVARIRKTGR